MCGIIGFNQDDPALMKEMLKIQDHRGPDDKGFLNEKGITIGNNRLAIIDLSKAGHQPLANHDESCWIVYNGEVYNFEHLKTSLEKKGYKFHSKTDTEVIVNAYTEYGEHCLQYLNGDFAFAIYDKKQKRIFVARDRMGVKPLYYYFKKGKFAFASEIKTLLKDPEIKPELNKEALQTFMALRYNAQEQTLFNDIKKLLPGHCAFFDLKTQKLSIQKYWDAWTTEESKESESVLAVHLRHLFEQSVRRRLISDVPLGAYLSGGIDSSAIVGMMRKVEGKHAEINTFSVGFGYGEGIDELPYAKTVAETFNTNHKEIIVKSSLVKTLPEIIWHTDEPMADPALIPVFELSKEAKQDVTVVLTGEGGDELFAGYEQYKLLPRLRKLRLPKVINEKIIPRTVKAIPKPILNKFFKYAQALGEEGIARFIRVLNAKNDAEGLLEIVAIFDHLERKQLFLEDPEKDTVEKFVLSHFKSTNLVKNLLNFDQKAQLPENFLMKTDKMTTAHSLEGRVPFLDHEFVEYANRIPIRLKIKGNQEKYIFKKAMHDILPKQIFERKKQRFYVPIDLWIKQDLKDEVKNVLSPEYIKQQKIFHPIYIQKIWRNYNDSPLFYARQIWNLMTFQMWYQIYIEQSLKIKN